MSDHFKYHNHRDLLFVILFTCDFAMFFCHNIKSIELHHFVVVMNVDCMGKK